MKKGIVVLLALVLCLGFGLFIRTGDVFSAAKYTISLGHVEVMDSSTQSAAEKFKELVEKKSKGEIEVFIHPSSELGTGPDMAQMCQMGAMQMGILPAGHMGGIIPEVQIFDIPFLLPGDIWKAAEVMNGPAAQILNKAFEKKDLIGMAFFPFSYKQFTANKKVLTPDDFKGLKWRTMASPIIIESYKALGASPVAIDYHELYTALQLGMAEGEENPFWTIGEMKFYEVQDYIIVSNHGIFVSILVASESWFKGLPKNIQDIIVDASKGLVDYAVKIDQKNDQEWREKIEKIKGAEIVELPSGNVALFRKALLPVRDVYVEMVGQSGKEILNAFVEESQKVEKPIKLDIVTCGPKTDGSWSQHLYDAYLNIKEKYPNIQISWTDTLPFAEHLPVFESLASKGANLIYTSEVGFEAARELAAKFPDTWFVIINLQPSHINEVPSNVTSYTVRAEEGGYLAGIAAGMMTKTNKLGHIAGMAYPCSIIPASGLVLGARSVNPDVTLTTVYLGSWNDPEKGYKAAMTLIDSGCDVILTMADDGNFGVINACKEKGVLIIGEARDMSEYAPDLFITSRLCPHPEMLAAAVEDFKSGEMKGNNVRYFGSKEGFDVIAPLRNVPDEVKQKVEEAKAKIKSGELKIPVVYDAEELDKCKNPPKK